jgi:hypothetical protein
MGHNPQGGSQPPWAVGGNSNMTPHGQNMAHGQFNPNQMQGHHPNSPHPSNQGPNHNMRMQLMQQQQQHGGFGGHQMPPPPPGPQQQMMMGHQMGTPRSPGPNQRHPHHSQQQQMHQNQGMSPHGNQQQAHQMHNVPFNQQHSGHPIQQGQQHHPMYQNMPNSQGQQNPNHMQQHQINSTNNSNLPIHMQPEFRIYEMNKRLASRPEQDINEGMCWDSFVNEFFDEEAKLSIRNVVDENLPKNFTISRTLIPRFFRSIYEGGVTDLQFNLTRGGSTNLISPPKPDPNLPPTPNFVVFESDLCTMTTKYGKPMYAIIFTEGHLVVEFSHDSPNEINHNSNIRIRNWIFSIRRHQELVPGVFRL